MRFSNPVAVTCLTCGQPTVVGETSIGSVRVHCGTWRWQCDIPATGTPNTGRYAVTAVGLIRLDTASDQELAA
ncbi:MAG: hypothetical protein ACRDSL_05380 [Pseudonocardiaceae bacterium]